MMNLFTKKSISTCISSATSQRLGRVKILICMRTNHQKLRISSMPEIRRAQRADGVASILAIGTANPDNIVFQAEYPDFYFRVNKCEHMIDLKDKFKRICEKSGIKKRHMYLTEDLLKENPHMCDYNASSLDSRQDILTIEGPKQGEVAATKAIKEWGQSKDKITHLIFCTMAGVDMPGADYRLTKLLNLSPSVNRFMLYHQGCYAGGTALRLAKDIAENNRGARVLVVCSEMTVVNFRGPTETHMSSMVSQALFGDGAGAVIVGSDLDESEERPLFDIVLASQTLLANSDGSIEGHLRQAGLHINLHKDVPKLISKNINQTLVDALGRDVGVVKPNNKIIDWNSMFWVAHPGGPAILDELELELGLERDRLVASRHVLSEFGNMSSACVLFILDEMRRRSTKEGKNTTGDGSKWGFLLGFGPGVTIETLVLRSCPI